MPTSQFDWASPPKQPFFNVFSNKRKADYDGENTQHNQLEDLTAKRCKYIVPHEEMMEASGGIEGVEQTMQPLWNMKNPDQPEPVYLPHHHTATSGPEQVYDPLLELNNNNTNNNCQESRNYQLESEDKFANLVPWPSVEPVEEMHPESVHIHQESAVMAMDSDYTPDVSQYRQAGHDASVDTGCLNFCSTSRSPGRFHCKPNWDATMDLKPYISDIY